MKSRHGDSCLACIVTGVVADVVLASFCFLIIAMLWAYVKSLYSAYPVIAKSLRSPMRSPSKLTDREAAGKLAVARGDVRSKAASAPSSEDHSFAAVNPMLRSGSRPGVGAAAAFSTGSALLGGAGSKAMPGDYVNGTAASPKEGSGPGSAGATTSSIATQRWLSASVGASRSRVLARGGGGSSVRRIATVISAEHGVGSGSDADSGASQRRILVGTTGDEADSRSVRREVRLTAPASARRQLEKGDSSEAGGVLPGDADAAKSPSRGTIAVGSVRLRIRPSASASSSGGQSPSQLSSSATATGDVATSGSPTGTGASDVSARRPRTSVGSTRLRMRPSQRVAAVASDTVDAVAAVTDSEASGCASTVKDNAERPVPADDEAEVIGSLEFGNTAAAEEVALVGTTTAASTACSVRSVADLSGTTVADADAGGRRGVAGVSALPDGEVGHAVETFTPVTGTTLTGADRSTEATAPVFEFDGSGPSGQSASPVAVAGPSVSATDATGVDSVSLMTASAAAAVVTDDAATPHTAVEEATVSSYRAPEAFTSFGTAMFPSMAEPDADGMVDFRSVHGRFASGRGVSFRDSANMKRGGKRLAFSRKYSTNSMNKS